MAINPAPHTVGQHSSKATLNDNWAQVAALEALLAAAGSLRERLSAARNYYVRTDGSDSNTGLVDSAAGAFLTIQKAIDVVAQLDIGIYNVTINIGAGTFTRAGTLVLVNGAWLGSGTVTLSGAGATTILQSTGAAGTRVIFVQAGGRLSIQNMKLQATVSNLLDIGVGGGTINCGAGMEFGATTGQHIVAAVPGSFINLAQNYTISGGALIHWSVASGGYIQCVSRTITLTGTPAFSFAFALCTLSASMRVNSNTFVGAATGQQYRVQQSAIIFAAGALPGNVAGFADAATGGYFV